MPNFAAEPQWLKQANLLTLEEVAAALGESVRGVPRRWDDSVVCNHPHLNQASSVAWEASTYLDFDSSDARVSTDVVVCSITDADALATSAMYADLEASAPPGARSRYEPATIGEAAFAWELDGEGGAVDRFVVVNTGHALVGIVANRHSPVAEADNLTREQVDNLVRAAVDKLS